ncbi:MAG: hypothetical protein KBS52_01020 [Clostridiales bacterium]|nr:hypothetical protein [Candidatus Equinaster intestinalis]
MLLVKNVNLPIETDFDNCKNEVAAALKINPKNIKSLSLYRKSVDARHKNNIVFCCSFLIETVGNVKLKNAEPYQYKPYKWQKCESNLRPLIVGFSPAGMFAALVLARAGLRPIVVERGAEVNERAKKVEAFFKGEKLDLESNIQFGEGGAGTFSDGKLNTGIKDVRCRTVLEQFVSFGAPKNILTDAKPHIGTDVLRNVVKSLRNEIEKLGGEIHFNTKLENIITENGKIKGAECSGKIGKIETSHIVLAIGHSARDTFSVLRKNDVALSRKPFSVGARIEHLQKDINSALYGSFANRKELGAADYKMAVHLENGRGVYTFCMCPGGEVVNASSEADGIAVNGMSNSLRNGENANSALLVEIKEDDLMGDDVFAGIALQREIEQNAFKAANGNVPYCFVGDLYGEFQGGGSIKPTVKPKAVHTDIKEVLPDFVSESIKTALPLFEKKISGFSDYNAVLTFPETRSTSPVRIDRNELYQSVNLAGLFPAGEGAGYAGGIMSAAVDGMRVAEAVIFDINNTK